MKEISVIILSWNRKNDTLATIESLSKSNISNYKMEIMVVDNGSEDGSQKAIKALLNKIDIKNIETKLIENTKNLGFVEGNNVGIKNALKNKKDYIVLLNDDTIVDKNLISELVGAAKKYKKAAAISPKIYFAKGFEYKKRYKKSQLGKVIWYAGGDIDWDNIYGTNHGVDEVDRGQFNKVKKVDFATGCCVLYKAEALRKVGLLDSRYFAYYEDSDISQRLKRAGWDVIYIPSGHLWHKVSQSSGIGSELNDYFITRNRMLFGTKYARLRTQVALIRESMKLLFFGRKWQRIGIRDFYLKRFGKGSWK